jgi:carboxymethylenebutenolidase
MKITLPSGTRAELCRPSTDSSSRGLVLWPDIMGLRPLFAGHAQRLADDHGWTVCCVELYPGEETFTIEQRFARVPSMRDVDKMADTVAAADACEVDPVGVMGFCMGGMYAMKALATGRFDRAVAFYGMVRIPEMWKAPVGAETVNHDAIESVQQRGDSELLCIFGLQDPWCPIAEIDEVEAAGATVIRYPDAEHGWAQDPTRDGYRADDAIDAWARAEAFLAGV